MRRLNILLVASILGCFGCGNGADKIAVASGPAQKATGVIISESEKGQSNWLLTTKEADFYDEEDYVSLSSPKLTSKTDGKNVSTITAAKGDYNIAKNLITLTGNVRGYSYTEKATIKTQKIFYNTETKKVWGNTPLTMTRGGVAVKGAGFVANGDFSQIQIFKQKTQIPKELAAFEP